MTNASLYPAGFEPPKFEPKNVSIKCLKNGENMKGEFVVLFFVSFIVLL